MKARRVMTRDVVCVTPSLRLDRVRSFMDEYQVRHMPVVFDGKLVGILSDRDVLLHTQRTNDEQRWRVEPITAGDAMSRRPITCAPDASLSRVAGLMLEHRIDSIPIASESGVLLGLITTADLIELLIEPGEALAEQEDLPFAFNLRWPGESSLAA